MLTPLDMSLEDLIKTNKRSSRGDRSGGGSGGGGGRFRGSGGGGGGSGPGPSRRFPNRNANRNTPYAKPARDSMFVDSMKGGGRATGLEKGTKLYISNLDYGVSNEDIKELFSELGPLKKYSINYDKSGRSKGTAEVVFTRKQDALVAVKKYHEVELDGKPMNIEVVAPVPVVAKGIFGNPISSNRSGQSRGGAAGRSRGASGGRGFGRGRGRGRGRGEPISAEALDADLEKYHTEAMQIN